MAKNSIFDPTKDGVKADNSGYSSNQIDKMIGESAAAVIDDDAAGDDTVYSSAKIYSLLPEDTATGAEVTITDACPDLPIVELHASINAVQEGTGDPSPDNVRPISGWDEITVTHDDIDVEISLGDNTIYGGTYNSDGTLLITHAMFQYDAVNNVAENSGKYYWTFTVTTETTLFPNTYDIISDYFKGSSGVTEGHCYTTGLGRTLVAVPADQTLNTKTLASEWCAEHNPMFVIPYVNPIELTVGTVAFNTNGEGSTIISCDSGDVTVTYKKLTTLS